MGFCLVNCWLSRSGLTSTLCAPTFINPEFHNPIFHPATQAARGKQNTNHCGNVVSAPAEKGLRVAWAIYDPIGLKMRHVVVHFLTAPLLRPDAKRADECNRLALDFSGSIPAPASLHLSKETYLRPACPRNRYSERKSEQI